MLLLTVAAAFHAQPRRPLSFAASRSFSELLVQNTHGARSSTLTPCSGYNSCAQVAIRKPPFFCSLAVCTMSDNGVSFATVAPLPLYEQFGWHVSVASWLSWWQWLILIGVIFYFMHRAIVAIIRRHQESVYWNWDNGGDDVTLPRDVINTDVDALSFPPDFLFGVATSAHQIEGGDGGLNQWSAWEESKDRQGQPRIRDGSRVGSGGQHWLRVDEDVKLLKELGVNSYRFSIEWSKVQPAAGEWNAAALQHYSDEVDQLLAHGIVPMITLQHFTIPTWFEELGGFELEENIAHFVAYAEKMFLAFRGRVQLWVTINEPFFYSFNGQRRLLLRCRAVSAFLALCTSAHCQSFVCFSLASFLQATCPVCFLLAKLVPLCVVWF